MAVYIDTFYQEGKKRRKGIVWGEFVMYIRCMKSFRNHFLTNFLLSLSDAFLIGNLIAYSVVLGSLLMNVENQTAKASLYLVVLFLMSLYSGLSFIYFVFKGMTGPGLTYSRFSTSVTIEGQIYTIRENAYGELEIIKGGDGRAIFVFFLNLVLGIVLMIGNFLRAIVDFFVLIFSKETRGLYARIDVKSYWRDLIGSNSFAPWQLFTKRWFWAIPILLGFILDILLIVTLC